MNRALSLVLSAAIRAVVYRGVRLLGVKGMFALGAAAFVLFAMVSSARAAELDYAEISAPVSVTATTAAAATTVVTGSAVVYDGSTKVCARFFAPYLIASSGSIVTTNVTLWDGGSDLGVMGRFGSTNGSMQEPLDVERCFTPAAGTRTLSVRAYRDAINVTVGAGAGGPGTPLPAFLRVTDEGGGGGGAVAWADVSDKPTFNADFLTDVDTTGKLDGVVLKWDAGLGEWKPATDATGEGGGSGIVTLSAGDKDRVDLVWWGVWALVGLTLVLMVAPALSSALRVTRGM